MIPSVRFVHLEIEKFFKFLQNFRKNQIIPLKRTCWSHIGQMGPILWRWPLVSEYFAFVGGMEELVLASSKRKCPDIDISYDESFWTITCTKRKWKIIRKWRFSMISRVFTHLRFQNIFKIMDFFLLANRRTWTIVTAFHFASVITNFSG